MRTVIFTLQRGRFSTMHLRPTIKMNQGLKSFTTVWNWFTRVVRYTWYLVDLYLLHILMPKTIAYSKNFMWNSDDFIRINSQI